MTTTASWVVAAAVALAWAARRRGEWEVWKGHAHLRSNLPLDRALVACADLWSGDPDDHVRAVVRRGGHVLAEIDWREEFDRRATVRAASGRTVTGR